MKIGDLARRTGLSAHTIRYYERIKLLPYASRASSQHREYDASILSWIDFIGRLKTAGMPIRDMLRYARLRERGPATEEDRRLLLMEHRAKVQAHVAELQACLAVLDTKIAGYAGLDTVETNHDATTERHERAVRERLAGPGGH
ncbi:MerR family transcriptional regulator [Bosea sp. Root670]|uniref:MerR family transcriptional regulator n=1 Tax=Bosea sp. Root670 TaxID=1736583 RepID=UPI000712D595|nr:MerR family transcriptional regulator [Bosea sp. Root670]KRE08307.1 MerR family transcriptional regulator [Bosea sp. Root670]